VGNFLTRVTTGRAIAAQQQARESSTPNSYSTTAMPSVSWDDDDYAKRMRSWLTREQYDDYKTRFMPHEEQLLDAVTGEQLLNERLTAIRNSAARTGGVSAGNASRTMGRYGVRQTQREREQSTTRDNLRQAATLASAENQTRQHIEDRDLSIISGGSTRQAIFME
jgi:hypothetical protein